MSNEDIFNRLQLFRRASNPNSDPDSPPRAPRPDPTTSRVKRCLFGRGNSEENIKFAKREMEKSLAESKKKWNFDFENEKPMEGRFEWNPPRGGGPYPIFQKVLQQENVENLHPENSISHSENSNSSRTSSEKDFHTSQNSSSSENCDHKEIEKDLAQGAISKDFAAHGEISTQENSSSSSTSNEACGVKMSSSQRSSSRQTTINQIYRQRKRSKSNVKVQERKKSSETEGEPSLPTSGAGLVTGSSVNQE